MLAAMCLCFALGPTFGEALDQSSFQQWEARPVTEFYELGGRLSVLPSLRSCCGPPEEAQALVDRRGREEGLAHQWQTFV